MVGEEAALRPRVGGSSHQRKNSCQELGQARKVWVTSPQHRLGHVHWAEFLLQRSQLGPSKGPAGHRLQDLGMWL